MERIIDFSNNLYELCKKYHEIVDIMNELGFTDITNPGMLSTVGRFMTIPKGAVMKGIPMDKIKETFQAHGYQIQNEEV